MLCYGNATLVYKITLSPSFQYTVCPEKNRPKCFSVISETKLRQFWWNLIHGFLNKFTIKRRKRFPPHLNNVSTLPCKTTNAHHAWATIELIQKETPEFIPPQLWLPNSPDLNPVDYRVWEHCKRRSLKYASLIWTNWNSDWEWSGTSWITSSLWQPSVSGVIDSSRSVMHVLYTFLQHFPHSVINWIQIWRIWKPQLRWDKSVSYTHLTLPTIYSV